MASEIKDINSRYNSQRNSLEEEKTVYDDFVRNKLGK